MGGIKAVLFSAGDGLREVPRNGCGFKAVFVFIGEG